MTNNELMIIAELLDMAGDQFSNHGCNDFDLRERSRLTPEEMIELDKDMHDRNGDPEEHDPSRVQWQADFALMIYFADRLRELAK